jgi:hypothetical protein
MKRVSILVILVLIFTVSFTSCREKKGDLTDKETIIEEAREEGAKIEVKDGGDKVKIEHPDGSETKIKTDDGDVKIKTDDNQ